MVATTAPRLYNSVAHFREEYPLIYECLVRDGLQNYNRLAVHADHCLDPHLVDGKIEYADVELHEAGGDLLTHVLSLINCDIADLPRLLEEGRDVRELVWDHFRPGMRSKVNHGVQAQRYPFKSVWPEDTEKRHICSNHTEAQKLGYRLLNVDDWEHIVRNADSDLVNEFENPPVNGMSREEQKQEFARAAEAFTLMGNCVDFAYQSAVDGAICYFEDVQSWDIQRLATL